MKRRRHTPEQIVRKLREVERLLGEGQTIAEAAKQVEISDDADLPPLAQPVRRDEGRRRQRGCASWSARTTRLKRIVADKELEIDALKEIARGNWYREVAVGPPVAPARGGLHVAGLDASSCRNGGHAGSPASTAPHSAAWRCAAAATTRCGRSCTPWPAVSGRRSGGPPAPPSPARTGGRLASRALLGGGPEDGVAVAVQGERDA